MRLRILVAIGSLALLPSVAGACSERAEGSRSWEDAVRQVERLTEVKGWRRYVSERPPAKVVYLPAVDKQSLIAGQCYWSVTLYSDEGTHLHRWNTFYVGVGRKDILVNDYTGGEPLSLERWRGGKSSETRQHRAR
jgi:hypothetical protein